MAGCTEEEKKGRREIYQEEGGKEEIEDAEGSEGSEYKGGVGKSGRRKV